MRNTDNIAIFASVANSQNWPADQMKAYMKEHLDRTAVEARDSLQGRWAADTAGYDKVQTQILNMAGIAPSNFNSIRTMLPHFDCPDF